MISYSILIPAYNAEKYLRRSLDSVLNQTYKDFEIILIDDGSTDSTPQICDEYAVKYSCVHVFHQENIGVGRTRDRLIDHAEGKYIFWLDADDYYDAVLLEKAVRAFEINSADIVVWGHVTISNEGAIKVNHIEEIGISKWQELNTWGCIAALWQYAARKELWDSYERIPENEDLTDDIWHTSQIVQKAKTIVSLGESLYFYDWTNANSITHLSRTGRHLYRTAYTFHKILKRNLEMNPTKLPLTLHTIRWLYVNAYCFNLFSNVLTQHQVNFIKSELQDLLRQFPMKKTKKLYIIQYCVLHGINFICRWHAKNRLKKFGKNVR